MRLLWIFVVLACSVPASAQSQDWSIIYRVDGTDSASLSQGSAVALDGVIAKQPDAMAAELRSLHSAGYLVAITVDEPLDDPPSDVDGVIYASGPPQGTTGVWAAFLSKEIDTNLSWDNLYSTLAKTPVPHVTRVDFERQDPKTIPYLLMLPGSILIDDHPPAEWKPVLEFRRRHPAVSLGNHKPLVNGTYSFARTIDRPEDTVVVAIGAGPRTTLNVSRAFADDTYLRDAMTGKTTLVSFGMATFDADPSGILLIEPLE